MIANRDYYETLMQNVQQDIVDCKDVYERLDVLINRLINDYNELEIFLSNFDFKEEQL